MVGQYPQSVGEAIAWGAAHLQGNRGEAQILLAHALDLPRAWLLAHPESPLNSWVSEKYAHDIAGRSNRVPVAYLRGYVDWYDLRLTVTRDVLVPRPETELLIEAVLGLEEARRAAVVADIGTGSGAVAIALARHLPAARVHAVDVSKAAVTVARTNADRYHLLDRIRIHRGDLTEPLPERPDVVVANLPYLSDVLMASVERDVRHEPMHALYGGEDGLDLYRRLVSQVQDWDVLPILALEIDADQAAAMLGLLRSWSSTDVHVDYAGLARVAVAIP